MSCSVSSYLYLVLFWSSWGSFAIIVGCLGRRFGHLGGRLVSFLVVLGVVLGSWGALGALLGGLGSSWGALGAVDAPKGQRGKFTRPLGSVFGAILASQDDPKTTPRRHLGDQDNPRGSQDGAQDDQKSIIKSI